MKRITTSLLFGCWLWALALAGSPALHEWLHGEEAGHDDHDCVVNLFALGGCPAHGVSPVAIASPIHFAVVAWPPADRDIQAAGVLDGTLEHGPPATRA